MKQVIFIFFFLFSLTTGGAVPTMEGLFRSGPNPAHKEDTFVLAKMTIRSQTPDSSEAQELYMRLLFSLKDLENPRLLQTLHHSNSFSPASTLKSVVISNLEKKIQFDPSNDRALIFSLLTMFFLNRSQPIARIIKRNEPSFMTNNEALDQKGVKLYQNYSRHLKRKKEEPQQDYSSYERKLKAEKQVYDNRSLYNRNQFIKLVKKMNRFFWEINLQHFTALFSNEKHQLHEFRLDMANGSVKIHIDQFKTFRNGYEIPQEIFFENANKTIVMSISHFQVFGQNKKYFRETIKRHLAFEKKNRQNLNLSPSLSTWESLVY